MSKASASQSQQPASPAMEDVPDRTAALARMGGAARLLAEMAGVLLQDCPKQLSAVCAAGAHHDSTLVERAAHKLEGSLGMLGAKEAFEAAQRLEKMVSAGDLTRPEEILGILDGALKRLNPVPEGLLVRRTIRNVAQKPWAKARS